MSEWRTQKNKRRCQAQRSQLNTNVHHKWWCDRQTSHLQMCLSVYAFPFGQQTEKVFNPLQSSKILTVRRWMWMMWSSAHCWVIDMWVGIGKWAAAEFHGNRKQTLKNHKFQHEKHRLAEVDTSLHCFQHSVLIQLFACYNFALLISWLMDQQQDRQGWLTVYHICTTYFSYLPH